MGYYTIDNLVNHSGFTKYIMNYNMYRVEGNISESARFEACVFFSLSLFCL